MTTPPVAASRVSEQLTHCALCAQALPHQSGSMYFCGYTCQLEWGTQQLENPPPPDLPTPPVL